MAAKAKPKAKPKAKAAPKKAAAKKAAPKKAAAKPKAAKDTGRHPGRRAEPQPKIKAAHTKAITKANDHLVKMEAKQIEDRRINEENVQAAKDALAEVIDPAQKDGYSTKEIAELIDKSRQTVFKLVAERIDGKTLNKPKRKKADATPAKAKAKPAKAKAGKMPKASKPGKAKPKAKKTVVAGRSTDLAGKSKPKPKPKPKVRPRPRPKA